VTTNYVSLIDLPHELGVSGPRAVEFAHVLDSIYVSLIDLPHELGVSGPRAVEFAHVLDSIYGTDLPFNLIGNGHNLQFGAMTVCLLAQLLHNLHKVLIVPRDEVTAPIQTRFARGGSIRPVGPVISLLKRFLLSQLPQTNKRLVTHAKLLEALVNHDLSHQYVLQ
jgi:hypothetical protein